MFFLWIEKLNGKLTSFAIDTNDTQPNNFVRKPSNIWDDISTMSLMTINDVWYGADFKHKQDNLIWLEIY